MDIGTVTNEAEGEGLQIEKMWKALSKDTTIQPTNPLERWFGNSQYRAGVRNGTEKKINRHSRAELSSPSFLIPLHQDNTDNHG